MDKGLREQVMERMFSLGVPDAEIANPSVMDALMGLTDNVVIVHRQKGDHYRLLVYAPKAPAAHVLKVLFNPKKIYKDQNTETE